MNIGDTVENRVCPHLPKARIEYIRNVAGEPPIFIAYEIPSCAIVSLTNQTIRITCVECYNRIKRALS